MDGDTAVSALQQGRSVGGPGSPPAGFPPPRPGKVVVPDGAQHAYELVEQLTVLPQRRRRQALADAHGLQRISGRQPWSHEQQHEEQRRHEEQQQRRLPSHGHGHADAEQHALARQWLAADHGSIAGFCAADMHAPLQLAPAATALVDVLAGLPIALEDLQLGEPLLGGSAAGQVASQRRAPLGGRELHGAGSGRTAEQNLPPQADEPDLDGYRLQDSFARGHFGEVGSCHDCGNSLCLRDLSPDTTPS